MFALSSVPSVTAPFSMNFMLLVPDASVPAVEICSDTSAAGIIFFRIADVVVLDKHHLHQAVHVRIAVHQFRQLVDILDDAPWPAHSPARLLLRTGRRWARNPRGRCALLQAIVCVQNGKSVQKLALILMQALYLHIQQEVCAEAARPRAFPHTPRAAVFSPA